MSKLFPIALGLLIALTTRAETTLDVQFHPEVHHQPLAETPWITSSGQTVTVTRLSALLSRFRLQTTAGQVVDLTNQYAFIDAVSKHLAIRLVGIPLNNYRQLEFTVGLDDNTNHGDPGRWPAGHPLNPILNSLHWSWQGGYVFFALEGHYNGDAGYSLHLAKSPNQTTISLPVTLDLHRHARANVTLDVEKLFDSIEFSQDAAATHSRNADVLAVLFRTNLGDSFSVGPPALSPVKSETPETPRVLIAKTATPYHFRVPAGFPIPQLPLDNPLTDEGVALGRRLFHERQLSRDNSQSCAACHHPDQAFSDSPRRFSIGVDQEPGTRNAMGLFNLAWKTRFFWDGRAASLRQQVLMPVQDSKEMHESLAAAVAKISRTPGYPEDFERAFGSRTINADRIARALEQFLLTIESHNSRFDHALHGDMELTDQEKRGFELFSTEYDLRHGLTGADCFHCHGGPLFSDYRFLNNGLAGVTNQFAVPSLRNVAVTAPYMHDGRFRTLEEVIDHYSTGVQRNPCLDPNLAKHPAAGLSLSADDKQALVAFLKTLTDLRYDQHAARNNLGMRDMQADKPPERSIQRDLVLGLDHHD